MKIYKFKDIVYEEPYSPYFDDYKNQTFIIDHYMQEDETNQHVWLICIDDKSVKVKGYVELYMLEEIKVELH